MRYSMVKDKPSNGGVQEPAMHYYSVAATSLFLAIKVEENCRKMRELVVACVRVAQKDPNKAVDEQDKEYWRWRDTLLQMEDLLLEAICFDLSVEAPYKTLSDFLVRLKSEDNKRLRNTAWAFLNDSCLTTLCLLFPSRTIAASALYAAAKHCGVRFQDESGRPWWEVVGVELKHIRRACNYMAEVYENNPLRGGSDSGIYERTPEDGDEWLAKTRERLEASEADSGSVAPDPSVSSIPGDGSPRKRKRDDGGGGGREGGGGEVNGHENHVVNGNVNGNGASHKEGHHKFNENGYNNNYNGVLPNGHTTQDETSKRLKTEDIPSNNDSSSSLAPASTQDSQSQPLPSTNGTSTTMTTETLLQSQSQSQVQSQTPKPEEEDVSEEGEVEEEP